VKDPEEFPQACSRLDSLLSSELQVAVIGFLSVIIREICGKYFWH
jgi:hypothetical protein